MADFLQQLAEQKRKVDFNTYDMTTKELVSLVADGTINISPEYQRQFRWEEERQSSLIESIFLGIAVPSLCMATNSDNTWEVIDGVQPFRPCLWQLIVTIHGRLLMVFSV